MSYIGKFQSNIQTDIDYKIGSTLFGTCSTPANEQEKKVLLPGFDYLLEGITLYVKFEYANTAENPTMKFFEYKIDEEGNRTEEIKVDSIDLYKTENKKVGTTPGDSWVAGSIVGFTYNDNKWIISSSSGSSSIVKNGILDMR